MSTPGLHEQIEGFVATCRTLTLATVADDGTPHAVNLQYVSDEGLDLYWVSSVDSAHSRHLAARPAAAVTIYGHRDDPANIHGLQLHGHAAALAPDTPAWQATWDRYVARFPFVAESPRFTAAVRAQSFYQFTPTWRRWIDNRRGFGWKHEASMLNGDR